MRILLVSLLLAVGSPLAHADQSTVDDLDVIDIRVDASQIEKRYNYPGLGGPHGYDAPDCLAVITGGNGVSLPDDALQRLEAGLLVEDGPGVLFPGPSWPTNTLTAQVKDQRVVFYLADLSKYVTGLRIAAKNHPTLNELIRSVFGNDYHDFVGLQVIRSCRL